jgi:DNA-binding NarL/FixJ family response regulator
MGAGTRFREAERELGLGDRSLKGRVQKLRRLSGKKRAAALVYWGLTEMYIHYEPQGLRKIQDKWLEVVELIAQDLTNRQVAERLHLSELAVESRIRYARAAVGARTDAQLVAICWSEDWIA